MSEKTVKTTHTGLSWNRIALPVVHASEPSHTSANWNESGRLGVQYAAQEQIHKQRTPQRGLFESAEPRWVEVNTKRVRVENIRDFGGYWLGLELIKSIGLDRFLAKIIPAGRESVRWSVMAQVLILCRLNSPSSELHIAEHLYAASGLEYLIGVPSSAVDDNRLYRALDMLLPHKEPLEYFLREKLGNLFELDYDILLYDVASTYFEGEAKKNPQAKRGYSRDKRFDCKQVCIALVVSRKGIPFGYEVFNGNRNAPCYQTRRLPSLESWTTAWKNQIFLLLPFSPDSAVWTPERESFLPVRLYAAALSNILCNKTSHFLFLRYSFISSTPA
ncbi:MAG: hypothetical protein ABIH42_00390 [Planctomycetota bacterium]